MKAPNYTPEQTATMLAMYAPADSMTDSDRALLVQEIADEIGKTVRSVRAKLTREGVYIAKTAVAKDGEPAVKKIDLAAELVTVTGLPLVSAEKLNKTDLKKLIEYIRSLQG